MLDKHFMRKDNFFTIYYLVHLTFLSRRLEIDPELRETTHIVVDEVHERSEDSDFLLMILRDTLKKVGFVDQYFVYMHLACFFVHNSLLSFHSL